jgi:hypothetical protein
MPLLHAITSASTTLQRCMTWPHTHAHRQVCVTSNKVQCWLQLCTAAGLGSQYSNCLRWTLRLRSSSSHLQQQPPQHDTPLHARSTKGGHGTRMVPSCACTGCKVLLLKRPGRQQQLGQLLSTRVLYAACTRGMPPHHEGATGICAFAAARDDHSHHVQLCNRSAAACRR